MSDERETTEPAIGGMVDRLELIEDQPLVTRAAAYGELHEQLRARLEGSDPRR
ncbi:hypothetical protein [Rathayibacter sp. VKM Ac-2754]|uniref:hypothetical protein n=1 Tax=Rathayibacter sp. VKM Ac-2754 TaxID=2609251 RepID=UPI00194E1296|nr:hypothetical protein [Rathayibacter sp. VKM Ac-2754]